MLLRTGNDSWEITVLSSTTSIHPSQIMQINPPSTAGSGSAGATFENLLQNAAGSSAGNGSTIMAVNPAGGSSVGGIGNGAGPSIGDLGNVVMRIGPNGSSTGGIGNAGPSIGNLGNVVMKVGPDGSSTGGIGNGAGPSTKTIPVMREDPSSPGSTTSISA